MKIARARGQISVVIGVVAALLLSGLESGQASTSSSKSIGFWTVNLKEGYTPYIQGLISDYKLHHA